MLSGEEAGIEGDKISGGGLLSLSTVEELEDPGLADEEAPDGDREEEEEAVVGAWVSTDPGLEDPDLIEDKAGVDEAGRTGSLVFLVSDEWVKKFS